MGGGRGIGSRAHPELIDTHHHQAHRTACPRIRQFRGLVPLFPRPRWWSWGVIMRTLLWQRKGRSQPLSPALLFASHRQTPSCDQEMAIGRTPATDMPRGTSRFDHGGVGNNQGGGGLSPPKWSMTTWERETRERRGAKDRGQRPPPHPPGTTESPPRRGPTGARPPGDRGRPRGPEKPGQRAKKNGAGRERTHPPRRRQRRDERDPQSGGPALRAGRKGGTQAPTFAHVAA
jgi:hypothetical protein